MRPTPIYALGQTGQVGPGLTPGTLLNHAVLSGRYAVCGQLVRVSALLIEFSLKDDAVCGTCGAIVTGNTSPGAGKTPGDQQSAPS